MNSRRTRVLAAALAAGCLAAAGLSVMSAEASVGNSGPVSVALSGEMFIDGATIDVTLPGINGVVSGTVDGDGNLDLGTVGFDPIPLTVSGIPSEAVIVPNGSWSGT
ncbi:MAG: hypothetical protein SGJ13_02610, partial [Actinomycetota bacterium]|nr:hypothetical protein [Actinomycetota bacterium]